MSDRLPPHARAMLDAMQREDTPNDAEQNRVKQRVFARLGLGAIGAAAATASSVVSHAATTASSTAVGSATASSTATVTSGASVGSAAAAGNVAGAGGAAGAGITSLLAAKLGTTKLVLGLTAVLATAGGAALLSETRLSETHSTGTQMSQAAASRALSTENPGAVDGPSVPPGSNVSPQSVAQGESPTEDAHLDDVEQDSPGSRPLVNGDVPSQAPQSVTQSRPSSVRHAPASSLQEEAQLLGLAHQKISQGQPAAALTVLAEHKQRFPRGTLALERQAAFAVARCLNGDTTRGRAEAERFRRKYPNSPMVKRLVSACQLSEP